MKGVTRMTKPFSYRGQTITASSKKEAIKQIVAAQHKGSTDPDVMCMTIYSKMEKELKSKGVRLTESDKVDYWFFKQIRNKNSSFNSTLNIYYDEITLKSGVEVGEISKDFEKTFKLNTGSIDKVVKEAVRAFVKGIETFNEMSEVFSQFGKAMNTLSKILG